MPLDHDRLRPSGALLGAYTALAAAIDGVAIPDLGVDPTTMDLLVRLDLAPDSRLRAAELCEQLLKSPSHISRVIDRAEAGGLVERSPDPADGRASLVGLTDAGSSIVAAFEPRLDAALQAMVFDVLDADERDALVDMLDRIEAAARSLAAAGHDSPPG